MIKVFYESKKSVDSVFHHLADVSKFVSIHPAIYKAVPAGPHEYEFFENVPLGFFSIPSSYHGQVFSDVKKSTVHMVVSVRNIVSVDLLFAVTGRGEGSSIEETITLAGPRILTLPFGILLKRVHAEMFRNLESV